MEVSVCRYFQMLMSGVISGPTDAAANTSANALVDTPPTHHWYFSQNFISFSWK